MPGSHAPPLSFPPGALNKRKIRLSRDALAGGGLKCRSERGVLTHAGGTHAVPPGGRRRGRRAGLQGLVHAVDAAEVLLVGARAAALALLLVVVVVEVEGLVLHDVDVDAEEAEVRPELVHELVLAGGGRRAVGRGRGREVELPAEDGREDVELLVLEAERGRGERGAAAGARAPAGVRAASAPAADGAADAADRARAARQVVRQGEAGAERELVRARPRRHAERARDLDPGPGVRSREERVQEPAAPRESRERAGESGARGSGEGHTPCAASSSGILSAKCSYPGDFARAAGPSAGGGPGQWAHPRALPGRRRRGPMGARAPAAGPANRGAPENSPPAFSPPGRARPPCRHFFAFFAFFHHLAADSFFNSFSFFGFDCNLYCAAQHSIPARSRRPLSPGECINHSPRFY